MKRLLFVSLFALAITGIAQAQAPTNPPPSQNCCDWWDYVYLNVDIDPILCIRLDGSDEGEVDYDCPSDFENPKVFEKGNGSPDFPFLVWSNMNFDISAHRHGDFSGPGPNQIAGSNAQVSLKSKTGIGGTSPALNTYFDIPYYNPGDPANGAPENIVMEAPPAAGNFVLNFRIKALANAWQYAPGNHTLAVHVTITND